MKLSEAIDRLEVGETVWVKATVDMINNEGKYIKVRPNVSSVYLDGHDGISLTEPTPIDTLAQEYDVEPDTIREWLDRGHKGSFEKVVVSQEFADWVEKAMVYQVMTKEWCLKEIANMGWVDWLHGPQNGEKYPCDDHWSCEVYRNKEKHIKAIYDGYTVKPKRWVVKFKDAETDFYFMGWSDIYKTDDNPFVPNGYAEKDKDRVFMFDDQSKAEAVAMLVEGSVEEV